MIDYFFVFDMRVQILKTYFFKEAARVKRLKQEFYARISKSIVVSRSPLL